MNFGRNNRTIVSIALVLSIHALLFLWVFPLHLSPDEKYEIGTDPFLSLPLPDRVVQKKGLHWLSVVLWDGDGEVELHWAFSQLCLKGDVAYFAKERGIETNSERPWPYRDVPVEYLPFGLLSVVVPALFSRDLDEYYFRFSAWLGLLHLLNIFMAVYLMSEGNIRGTQMANALWWSAAFLLCFGNIVSARFDHFVATMMLSGALIFDRAVRADGRKGVALSAVFGGVAAIGVLTKVVPGLVLAGGIMVLWAGFERYEWVRRALAALSGFVGTLLLLSAVFHLLFGRGYWSSFTYHMERGIQVESLYAGVLMLAHLAGIELATVFNYGSFNLVTSLTSAVQAVSPLFLSGLLALIAVRVRWCGFDRGSRMLLSGPGSRISMVTLMLLLAFLLTNKVFSPQYLLWVAPFVAAAAAVRKEMELPGRIFLVATLLTQIVLRTYGLLLNLQWGAATLLNLRNLLLVWLLIFLLIRGLPWNRCTFEGSGASVR